MKKLNIVIVEDNFSVADTLARALNKEFSGEAQVEVFRTGEAALKMLAEKPCDLLITDWQLPGLSGLELILKVRPVQAEMKIIFMTAYPSEQIAERVRQIADLYLLKPFRIPVLIGHIHQLLGREGAAQADHLGGRERDHRRGLQNNPSMFPGTL